MQQLLWFNCVSECTTELQPVLILLASDVHCTVSSCISQPLHQLQDSELLVAAPSMGQMLSTHCEQDCPTDRYVRLQDTWQG